MARSYWKPGRCVHWLSHGCFGMLGFPDDTRMNYQLHPAFLRNLEIERRLEFIDSLLVAATAVCILHHNKAASVHGHDRPCPIFFWF